MMQTSTVMILDRESGIGGERQMEERMKAEVVRESKIGLDWIGKTVTLDNKELGEGIVVGYSSITGEPLAYFYSGYFGDRICSFSHKKVIKIKETIKCETQERVKPTLNDIRKEHGLEPLVDGDVVLTKA